MISRVGVRHCWRYSQQRVVLLVQAHDLAVAAPADPAQVDGAVHGHQVALQDVGLVVDLPVGVVAEAVAAHGQDHPERQVRAAGRASAHLGGTGRTEPATADPARHDRSTTQQDDDERTAHARGTEGRMPETRASDDRRGAHARPQIDQDRLEAASPRRRRRRAGDHAGLNREEHARRARSRSGRSSLARDDRSAVPRLAPAPSAGDRPQSICSGDVGPAAAWSARQCRGGRAAPQ